MADELVREVLVALYGSGSYWTRCGGPERRAGLTEGELLASLESRFPTSVWDAELLQYILQLSLKQGTVKFRVPFAGTCPYSGFDPGLPGPAYYYGNNSMVIVNYANHVYYDVAPALIWR